MRTPAPSPHRHRFARAETWAKLWLAWLGRYLVAGFGFLPPLPRAIERECQNWLDQIATLIAWLLIARACAKLGGHRFHTKRRPGVPAATLGQSTQLRTPLRVILGADLSRRFKRGSIGERIRFLYCVLADMDGFAAQLAERLSGGYTRLTPILGAPASPPIHSAQTLFPQTVFALDTS